jgi:deoxycytidine triphosphate deaminase
MEARTGTLYKALLSRLAALEDDINTLRGELAGGRPGVRNALEVVVRYPKWIKDFVVAEYERTPDTIAQHTLVQAALSHVVLKSLFIESWFAQGTRLRIPRSLYEAVERRCIALEVGPLEAVLALGPSDNFETSPKDLADYLFSTFGAYTLAPPQDLPKRRFALLQVPRREGGEALWRPIILGHEIAHLAAIHHDAMSAFDLESRFDWQRFSDLELPPRFFTLAENWVRELICDAFTVHAFGPAGVASLSEFLDVVGATGKATFTHPPGYLRIRLLTRWLGKVKTPMLKRMVTPWLELASSPQPPMDAWAVRLAEHLETFEDDIIAVAASWPGTGYEYEARVPMINKAAQDLELGIPPQHHYAIKGQGDQETLEEDAINAGWVIRTKGSDWPIDKLIGKALDTQTFVRSWEDAGGSSEDIGAAVAKDRPRGVLAREEIIRRFKRRGQKRLIVSPLLSDALGTASLDLRLGPHFLVFRKTEVESFDPLTAAGDPRSLQRRYEVGWGERFILHPNELALASSLEYIAMPDDLSAQLVTRSSYGRLGLITATAVQVHPFYRGCLTLELLNLGEIPLALQPGERIAQLVFVVVEPAAHPADPSNFDCPIEPEFSGVAMDADAPILRKMREIRQK